MTGYGNRSWPRRSPSARRSTPPTGPPAPTTEKGHGRWPWSGAATKALEVLEEEEDLSAQQLETASEDAPVVKLVNTLLSDAIKKRASDIHIEPYERLLPGPLPRRQRALRVHAPRRGKLRERDDLDARQDHGVARHRRAPPAADGRIKVKVAIGDEPKEATIASRSCRPSSARRSSCVCSTRATSMLDVTQLRLRGAELPREVRARDPAAGTGWSS